MEKLTQGNERRTCGRDTGQNLSLTGVSGFTHGSGFLDGNGFVHYKPDANYFGAASNDSMGERRAA